MRNLIINILIITKVKYSERTPNISTSVTCIRSCIISYVANICIQKEEKQII